MDRSAAPRLENLLLAKAMSLSMRLLGLLAVTAGVRVVHSELPAAEAFQARRDMLQQIERALAFLALDSVCN